MIQVENHDDEVFISVDAAGIDALIAGLNRIKDGGDHEHFMSPEWGGKELDVARVNKENTPVNHLKISLAYS